MCDLFYVDYASIQLFLKEQNGNIKNITHEYHYAYHIASTQ